MSDTMLNAIIRMPYDMVMASELSRIQFYDRAQSLLDARAADKYLIDQLYRQRDDYAMHNMAVRQCTGIPRSVGVSEPVEGFEDRPQDLAPAMREMALIIEADKARIAELEAALNHVRKELGIDWLHPCFDAARDALSQQGKENES